MDAKIIVLCLFVAAVRGTGGPKDYSYGMSDPHNIEMNRPHAVEMRVGDSLMGQESASLLEPTGTPFIVDYEASPDGALEAIIRRNHRGDLYSPPPRTRAVPLLRDEVVVTPDPRGIIPPESAALPSPLDPAAPFLHTKLRIPAAYYALRAMYSASQTPKPLGRPIVGHFSLLNFAGQDPAPVQPHNIPRPSHLSLLPDPLGYALTTSSVDFPPDNSIDKSDSFTFDNVIQYQRGDTTVTHERVGKPLGSFWPARGSLPHRAVPRSPPHSQPRGASQDSHSGFHRHPVRETGPPKSPYSPYAVPHGPYAVPYKPHANHYKPNAVPHKPRTVSHQAHAESRRHHDTSRLNNGASRVHHSAFHDQCTSPQGCRTPVHSYHGVTKGYSATSRSFRLDSPYRHISGGNYNIQEQSYSEPYAALDPHTLALLAHQ